MKRLPTFLATFLLLLAGGCATGPQIDTSYTAVGQDSRVQYLVLHYTVGNFPSSLKTLTQGAVSSHYLVRDDPPTIYRLVDENRRAFHAGVSYWRGGTQLNASSIGIEIVNAGWVRTPDGGMSWAPFPPAQVDAVIELVKWIVERHKIPPERVVGHSDIAPTRKQDPGPLFPWKRLADLGLILWPDPQQVAQRIPQFETELPDVEWFQLKLSRHGFAVPLNGQYDDHTVSAISAFQMKYRPSIYDGRMDAETAALLDVLTEPGVK